MSNLNVIGSALLAVAIASYVLFCAYLALDMAAHMGLDCTLGWARAKAPCRRASEENW